MLIFHRIQLKCDIHTQIETIISNYWGVACGAEYNRYDMVDIFFKQLKLREFSFTNNWVGSKIWNAILSNFTLDNKYELNKERSRQSDIQAMYALRVYSITVIIETGFYYLCDLHPFLFYWLEKNVFLWIRAIVKKVKNTPVKCKNYSNISLYHRQSVYIHSKKFKSTIYVMKEFCNSPFYNITYILQV